MIDYFGIFHKTGLVVWEKTCEALKGHPVNNFIQKSLLEERAGNEAFSEDGYTVKHELANELGLIFVAVYQTILPLMYIDDLLKAVKEGFVEGYQKDTVLRQVNFSSEFEAIHDKIVMESSSKRRRVQRAFRRTEKEKRSSSDEDDESVSLPESEMSEMESARDRLRRKGGMRGHTGKKKPTAAKKPESNKVKNKRTWDDSLSMDSEDAKALDMSKAAEDEDAIMESYREKFASSGPSLVDIEESDGEEELSDEDEDETTESSEKSSAKGSWGIGSALGSAFSSFKSGGELTEENLGPALEAIKKQLITKNVAIEVAETVCASVRSSLMGSKVGRFTRASTVVEQAVKDALTRVLTPKRSVDMLREIAQSKAEGKAYSICFVGVNGVGKSTSLAKVAYYLTENKYRVLIAACDTFRSGAVEQLERHGRLLGVPIFNRGYAKDPSGVAAAAIRHAEKEGYDVVLIDTAGRMQNKEPLMRALAKLVSHNEPNLVLFVGEALVGNDAIEQLTGFNRVSNQYYEAKPHFKSCVEKFCNFLKIIAHFINVYLFSLHVGSSWTQIF
eukprot:TRINITY_DN9718_c0_g1_i1.p1 TRINITY_DN9718_c0_g1~~TRINITY_DN9718_c0_g1_i1.p1  ORF type:complete len:560 (-),score=204.69 TRINITY_DN9718_c0_g1_i1:216-1895(-)